MLLVVDVGNTQTHFGVFHDGEDVLDRALAVCDRAGSRPATSSARRCRTCWRCAACRSPTSTARSCPRRCPQLSEQWTAMAESLPRPRDARRRPADPDRDADPDRQPARGRRRPARQRGRRVRRVGDACVVVDFGTAITYDAVSAAGEYLGGIITPGAEISIDALYERAAKLPKVELAPAARR